MVQNEGTPFSFSNSQCFFDKDFGLKIEITIFDLQNFRLKKSPKSAAKRLISINKQKDLLSIKKTLVLITSRSFQVSKRLALRTAEKLPVNFSTFSGNLLW